MLFTPLVCHTHFCFPSKKRQPSLRQGHHETYQGRYYILHKAVPVSFLSDGNGLQPILFASYKLYTDSVAYAQPQCKQTNQVHNQTYIYTFYYYPDGFSHIVWCFVKS